MRTECPICHNALEVEPEWLGKKAQCPYCDKKFIVTRPVPVCRETSYSGPVRYDLTPIWRWAARIIIVIAIAGGAYWAYNFFCGLTKKPEALFDEGKLLYKKRDYAEAVKLFRKAAERGYAPAQFYFGQCYADGKGVPKDREQAVHWCRKAAEQGHTDAQFYLGVYYYGGKGVPKDRTEALKWFRKAAEQGHVESQTILGTFYETGEGLPKDREKAVYWYRRAAEQGFSIAQEKLRKMGY